MNSLTPPHAHVLHIYSIFFFYLLTLFCTQLHRSYIIVYFDLSLSPFNSNNTQLVHQAQLFHPQNNISPQEQMLPTRGRTVHNWEDIVEALQDLANNEEGRRTSVETIDLVIGGDYMDWLPGPGCDCCDSGDNYQQIKSWLDPKYLWIDTNDEEGRQQAPV